MGVQGLWQLLEQTKRSTTLDSLEGKRLAVDVSLWLCQAAQGYNTYTFGSRCPHIQMLVSRIAKLLFYKIYPIFVFDGKNVPALKKQVLNERALRRHMDDIRMNKKKRMLLEQLAKQQLATNDPVKREEIERTFWARLTQGRTDDQFELPELPTALLIKRTADSALFNSSESFEECKSSESSWSSSTFSDENEDDFLSVTDDEDTLNATTSSNEFNNIKFDEVTLRCHQKQELPLSSGMKGQDQQKLDLQILSERIKDGFVSFSQLINIKSTASQPSLKLEKQECVLEASQLRISKNDKVKKRKSDESDERPSPKKSALPRVYGINEDDWMPEHIIGVGRNMTKAAKKKSTNIKENAIESAIDNAVVADCQQLLSLLGLPYLIANGEAEAQCVELERLGLCEGVVTDDSDAWLFGVRICYKNMFNRRTNVEEFSAARVFKELGLSRTKFIAIGMLSGGDYCHGFDGVGCVTALKLIREVCDVKMSKKEEDKYNDNEELNDDAEQKDETYEEGLERLQKIRAWLDSKAIWQAKHPTKKLFREPKKRKRLRKTIEDKNDILKIMAFPSEEVYNAYMRPNVNSDSQHFEWLPIDFEDLHNFLCAKVGWSADDLRAHTFGGLERWDTFVRQRIASSK